MADINTLARKCGVSKATVSRVFTGRARVSDEIRARVLAPPGNSTTAPSR